jgi:hypothetical protein
VIIRCCVPATKDHEVSAAAIAEAGRSEQKLAELMGQLGEHIVRAHRFR